MDYLPTRRAINEAKKIKRVCSAFEKDAVCKDKEKLLELFGNYKNRYEVLADFVLLICVCQILDINQENVSEDKLGLVKEEMYCYKKDAREFTKEELEVLTKHHFQVNCEACWQETRAMFKVLSPLINIVMREKINSTMDAGKKVSSFFRRFVGCCWGR